MKLLILHVVFFYVSVSFTNSDRHGDITKFVFPPGVQTCSYEARLLNECLKDVFQPMLSTIYISSITLKDTTTYGFKRSHAKDVYFKLDEGGTHLEVESFAPRANVQGSFEGEIVLNEVKLNPKGFFNVTMTDVKFTQMMDGKFGTKNGTLYFLISKFDVDYDIGDMKIHGNGLFSNPILNAIILDYINQYWREIYKIVLPLTRVYWEPLILSEMNEIMLHVQIEK